MDSDEDDALPPGWEERAAVDGNIYYVNHVSKSTQWIHPVSKRRKMVPSKLPYGWTKIVESDGKIMYSEESTNIHTYTDPRLAFAYELKDTESFSYKYDGFSCALDVLHGLDLSSKVAIVSGANSGIGFETAASLAQHGCNVVFACRSEDDAVKAISKVKNSKIRAKCIPMKLDLSSLNSVEKFSDEFNKLYKNVDILILNAGVFCLPYSITKDGYESTFQICYLSHFHLVKLLKNSILSAYSPRIVVVSSESHRFSNLCSETLDSTLYSPKREDYWSLMAYNNAKLCNMLFVSELHQQLYSKGVNVYAVHPGNLVRSRLSRYRWIYEIIFLLCSPFTKSLQQAASTSVFCSTSPSLNKMSGLYFNNCQICDPSDKAKDRQLAQQLWVLSENLLRTCSSKNE
ncbi:WW domain-containing oxidoreductase [Planococcus citri]|uniref:WW domain-containing oxidoreductase n=1 Tax=Planococcus citri TaxID=170843 RepID=UPI0031FA407A